MNDVKHRLCYLSLDFDAELALTQSAGDLLVARRTSRDLDPTFDQFLWLRARRVGTGLRRGQNRNQKHEKYGDGGKT